MLRFLPKLSSGKILMTAVGDGAAQICGQQLTVGCTMKTASTFHPANPEKEAKCDWQIL
jgi:hypothetical protein